MPIHDWTRVSAGTFHDFHQGWTIEIRGHLNSGVLPAGYYAMADQRVSGPEPDIVALRLRGPEPTGGLVVAETPPRIKRAAGSKPRRPSTRGKPTASRSTTKLGRVVAMIEVVSPGNKDSKHAIASFIAKAVDFIRNGIHFLVIDLFPPGPRDPRRHRPGDLGRAGRTSRSRNSAGGQAPDRRRVRRRGAVDRLRRCAGRRRPSAGCAPVPRSGLVRQRPARTDLQGLVGRDAEADPRARGGDAGDRGAVTASPGTRRRKMSDPARE